jgi:hypothetical protein
MGDIYMVKYQITIGLIWNITVKIVIIISF